MAYRTGPLDRPRGGNNPAGTVFVRNITDRRLEVRVAVLGPSPAFVSGRWLPRPEILAQDVLVVGFSSTASSAFSPPDLGLYEVAIETLNGSDQDILVTVHHINRGPGGSIIQEHSHTYRHTELVKDPSLVLPPPLPDLIPEPAVPGFCRNDQVFIYIRNRGVGVARSSTTRVQFSSGESFDVPTSEVFPGEAVFLQPINIPPRRPGQGDVRFTITADVFNVLEEEDKTNNTAQGVCLG